jgi:hypothetical protein
VPRAAWLGVDRQWPRKATLESADRHPPGTEATRGRRDCGIDLSGISTERGDAG